MNALRLLLPLLLLGGLLLTRAVPIASAVLRNWTNVAAADVYLALAGVAGLGSVLWGMGLGRAAAATLDDGALQARILIWPRAIKGIEDFPLTGMGLYTFQHEANVLYPPFGLSADVVLSHAHNLWLQVALDVGLPGL